MNNESPAESGDLEPVSGVPAAGEAVPDEDKVFDEIIANFKQNRAQSTPSDSGLFKDSDMSDNHDRQELLNRSKAVTEILQHYSLAYIDKIGFQERGRKVLFWGLGIVVVVLVAALLIIAFCLLRDVEMINAAGAAAIISAFLSFSVSIIELVKIITKYCFPENGEEYIVKIVESVQNNDFKTLQELIGKSDKH